MSSRSNEAATADGTADSEVNLLHLFKPQSDHRVVVTRQDLNRDYDNDCDKTTATASPPCPAAGPPEDSTAKDDDDDDDDDDVAAVTINNYYTWNSSRTNASILKERAAIISALHSVKSASSLLSLHGQPRYGQQKRVPWPPPWSKIFTRSHRVRDIVAICTDDRHALHASEEYSDRPEALQDAGAAVGTAGHRLMEEYAYDRSAKSQWPRGLGRDSTCWSCTAVYGGSYAAATDEADFAAWEDEEVEEKEEELMDVNEVDETTTSQPPSSSSWTWKRKLNRMLLKFKRKTDE